MMSFFLPYLSASSPPGTCTIILTMLDMVKNNPMLVIVVFSSLFRKMGSIVPIMDCAELFRNPYVKYSRVVRSGAFMFVVLGESVGSFGVDFSFMETIGIMPKKNKIDAIIKGMCHPIFSERNPLRGGAMVPPIVKSRLISPKTVASEACADAEDMNAILAGPTNASAMP